MEICLSHWSALQAWRHVRSLGPAFVKQVLSQQRAAKQTMCFKATPQELISLRKDYGLDDIDAAVCSRAKKYERLGVNIHAVPQRRAMASVAEIVPGLQVTTPECTFMHLTGDLGVVGLIALGFEFCSIYAIGATGSLDDSVPLTSLERLENALPLAANKDRAEKALCHVLERSRSPRETEAAMKLTLPIRMGGFAQRGLMLNEEVRFGEEARMICGKEICYPDMLFRDSKLAFEYDGRDYHRGREQEDELRRVALAHEGYRIERITYECLANRESMRELANVASLANTGRSLRIRAVGWDAASRRLYSLFRSGPHVRNASQWKV